MDWKLELAVLPVSDVDRAKTFYTGKVGFCLDCDRGAGQEFRMVQMTPKGSACAIAIGTGITELRGLRWDHVDLDKGLIHVWRSARRGGDVKTPKSRRSLSLPKRAVTALRTHRKRQAAERLTLGNDWHDNNLVFCHPDGHQYTRDDLNWRFAKVTAAPGSATGTPTKAGTPPCRS